MCVSLSLQKESPTYLEEQEQLKTEFKQAAREEGEHEEDSLLTIRKKNKEEMLVWSQHMLKALAEKHTGVVHLCDLGFLMFPAQRGGRERLYPVVEGREGEDGGRRGRFLGAARCVDCS